MYTYTGRVATRACWRSPVSATSCPSYRFAAPLFAMLFVFPLMRDVRQILYEGRAASRQLSNVLLSTSGKTVCLCNIRRVGWMNHPFPGEFFQFLQCLFCLT
ncbi:uncharacterized protein LOC143154035 [Ptiloglossa arizonensis]|uniref:uncharacterized protein LOC143154035 n=1 Tax=Ptiloglossa arizonensis TaxID=3350558 RepID=UPI003F9EC51E